MDYLNAIQYSNWQNTKLIKLQTKASFVQLKIVKDKNVKFHAEYTWYLYMIFSPVRSLYISLMKGFCNWNKKLYIIQGVSRL